MRILGLFTSTPRPLKERLIEAESLIGGKLFRNELPTTWQRFWFHDGDWFHERHQADGQQIVIRYQLTETSAHKLINGQEVAFDHQGGELEALLEAIKRYHHAIKRDLYFQKDGSKLAA